MTAIRVIISGRVQGVWFRGWTIETATRFGLDGWVRNRRDGTVEAVFSGPEEKLQAMREACRRGPPMARVVHVEEIGHEGPVESGFTALSSV
ncbi:MAG: acylphosphatase [Pseudomonadota bacterium]